MQYTEYLYNFYDRHETNFFTENFIRFLKNEVYLFRFIRNRNLHETTDAVSRSPDIFKGLKV
jgi:hypothetical protein